MNIFFNILIIIILVAAAGIGYFVRSYIERLKGDTKSKFAERKLADAEKEASHILREAQLKVKEQEAFVRVRIEKENQEMRKEIQRRERQVGQREENADKRSSNIDKREDQISSKYEEAKKKLSDTDKKLRAVEQKNLELDQQLSKVAQMSRDEAQKVLLDSVRAQSELEIAKIVKSADEEAHELSQRKAQEIMATAIERYSGDVVNEITVSVVQLPNDEMKGRLIGREGRNIRAFENATGVNIIIDDTPGSVVISSFNPIRREIAHRALNSLIIDGRIQPGRIEEVVRKSGNELAAVMNAAAEQALLELNIHNVHPEIKKLLGRLKFRTSYGQNILKHSVEMGYMTGIMAAELGLNEYLARRAGLLHDIGKAVDFEIEGSHAKIGADLARKYGENETVINSIESHHEDVPATTPISVLVSAADTLSAARPGARRETLTAYLKRIKKLEDISYSFAGIEKAYAIQAGREVRIIVKPTEVDDNMASKLSHDIAEKIEKEMEYPGKIKVTVIREIRAETDAK